MRLLVCGGRDFADHELFLARMAAVDQRYGINVVIDGGARGADSMAALWAINNGRESVRVFADWDRYGARAGTIRNRLMAETTNPDVVLAFPGGAGTRNMMGVSRFHKIPVWEAVPFPPPPPWP